MKLYDYPLSGNGYKVRLLLSLLERPYQYVPVDILRGDTRQPEFLAKNPNGRIPLLELSEAQYLPESNAILYYLAQGSRFWPKDPLAQAQVLQWLFFEQYSHEPHIATLRFWLHCQQRRLSDLDPVQVAEKYRWGYQALAVMETHLSQRDFFVGNQCSIADLALYAYTHVAAEGGFELAPYPAIGSWLHRIRTLPKYVDLSQWPSS